MSAALDPHFKSTYLEQFNVAVEREFGATVVSLTYVGELGRRMAYYLPDANTYPSNTGVAGGSGLRKYAATAPNVTTVPQFTSRGHGSYNGLQFVTKRRLTNGLDLSFNYTYAHGLDDWRRSATMAVTGLGRFRRRYQRLNMATQTWISAIALQGHSTMPYLSAAV